MRTSLYWLPGLLLLTGCARSVPPAADAGGPAPQAQPLNPANPEGTPDGPATVYQGQTVQRWEQQLYAPAPAAQQQASLALRELGEAGYPALLKGLSSNNTDVRGAALMAMPRGVMVAHKGDTLPLLRQLLLDQNENIRQSAAARLAWFGAAAGGDLPTLRAMAARDQSPAVRSAAGESVRFIDIAVSGRNPSYTGAAP